MKWKSFFSSSTGWISLVVGIAFCILLFSYGVTQEVPLGQLEGIVVLSETGKPLPQADVCLSVKDDDNARDRYVTADSNGHFRFRNVKVGDYEISVSAQEHHAKKHFITILEGRTLQVTLKLNPNAPYLKMYASQRVWAPGDPPQLELHGFRAGDKVDVEIDRISFSKLIADGEFSRAVKALRSQEGFNLPASFTKYSQKQVEFPHRVVNRDSEGAFVEPLDIPVLPEGFYWVRCKGDGARGAAYINVSHIALVTKSARGHALAYVTDLVTGKPVPGVKIWSRDQNSHISSTTTNADGLASAVYSSDASSDDNRATFIAAKGNSTATVGIYTSEDSEDSGKAKFVIYTDRPIYRPGDEVQFKGIVRQKSGLGYLPPLAGKVKIQINDTDDQPLTKFSADVSTHGTFSGHFVTSKEAGPGLYRIVATGFGSRGSHFVEMTAYRKPEMSIQIKSLRPYYFIGDKAQASIQCSYYFGGPVVGAKLSVSIYTAPQQQFDQGEDDDSDNQYRYGGGSLSKNIEATTDAKGQAVVQFDTRDDKDKSLPMTDLNFSVSVSATDASNKFVSGDGTVKVVRGSYAVSAAPDSYLASPNQMVDLLVRTRSNDPGGPPAPNRALTIQTSLENWLNDRRILTPLREYHSTTGADGVAHVAINASKPGTMIFKVSSRDDAGRVILSEAQLYVTGGKWHAEADELKFEIVLNKRQYKLGDTARVMLRTLVPGGSALLTAQTDRILWKKVVPLTSSATMVDLPVTPELMPNCFINVAYVHKKKFYEGVARLRVQPGMQKLDVSVSSDKPVFKPGDQAHLTVRTRDANGNPTPSEVSLAVVDESIYAIKPDSFDIFEQFYPKRTNMVTTSYSFAEVYLDGGDKGGANVTVRKKFLDTAAWIPSVQTDSNGLAKITVTLPDNLTEWRATAIGVTDSTSVGKATTIFRAKKQLMVRLEMPEFLVQQDARQMTVIVNNDTGSDKEVNVSLMGKGIKVLGELRQTIHVPADSPANLTFNLQTGDPGPATLTAKAWIVGGPNDGVEQQFPVLAHGTPVRLAWSEDVSDAKDFPIDLPRNVDRTTGRVKVTLSGSLAGNLVSSLDDLIGFPYGCVEQTMSRFMPSVLVSKTVRQLGLPLPKLEKQIPKIAMDSMMRLGRMQHEDGGFGWWENDPSDPFMTALVLDGLDRSKNAGFPIHKVNVEKALAWCRDRVHGKDWQKDSVRSKSYLIYVLARYGKRDEAIAAYKTLLLRSTSPADRATLILATNELGDAFQGERDRMLDRLTDLAHQGPLGAYWDNSDEDWGSESTALALTAYMTVRPHDPIVPRIVRYLIGRRKGDSWDSTRDTSYALVGLTMYLAKSKELVAAFQVNVSLEGKSLRSISLDSKNPDMQATSFEIPISEFHPGSNTLWVEKNGKGICYAAIDLQATQIQAQLVPSEPIPGFHVVRKYYRMEAQKLEDGTLQLLRSKRPITYAESGDTIRVELTVTSTKPRQFILIEDPTPSNCRVTEREVLDEGEEWSFWWDRVVIRDERVAFFIRNLQAGTQTISYTMRAEGVGLAHALPTSMSNMYDLAEKSSGGESLLEVK